MAQGLRALDALLQDPDLIPRSHSSTQPSISLVSENPMLWSYLLGHEAYLWYLDTHSGKTPIHLKQYSVISFSPLKSIVYKMGWLHLGSDLSDSRPPPLCSNHVFIKGMIPLPVISLIIGRDDQRDSEEEVIISKPGGSTWGVVSPDGRRAVGAETTLEWGSLPRRVGTALSQGCNGQLQCHLPAHKYSLLLED